MADYVRVRDKDTGHHLSILRTQYDRNPDAWAQLKQEATYSDGTPLPPKHHTSVSSEAARKNDDRGQSADTPKEK